MKTVKDVLSYDSVYIKLKPLDIGEGGEWGGEIEVTVVCPNTVPVNRKGEILLCDVAAMMSASLILYEDNEDIREMAEQLVHNSNGGEYMLKEKPHSRVVQISDNVIKLNFKE